MAHDAPTPNLPVGTVTFMLTDVDLSTQPAVLASHRGVRLDREVNGAGVGRRVRVGGRRRADAIDLLRALDAGTGCGGSAPPARIGIHTGEARLADGHTYVGAALHRGARLRDVAHAGQTLLSAVTASIVTDVLPAGGWLRDLAWAPSTSTASTPWRGTLPMPTAWPRRPASTPPAMRRES